MTQTQPVWTYSIYEDGHQRPIPKECHGTFDESNEYDLESLIEACASDDHSNYDGFERGDERYIFLFKNGAFHSKYFVHVDVEPVFEATREK